MSSTAVKIYQTNKSLTTTTEAVCWELKFSNTIFLYLAAEQYDTQFESICSVKIGLPIRQPSCSFPCRFIVVSAIKQCMLSNSWIKTKHRFDSSAWIKWTESNFQIKSKFFSLNQNALKCSGPKQHVAPALVNRREIRYPDRQKEAISLFLTLHTAVQVWINNCRYLCAFQSLI